MDMWSSGLGWVGNYVICHEMIPAEEHMGPDVRGATTNVVGLTGVALLAVETGCCCCDEAWEWE
jgi:predicted amino acid dehydrogenase